jgi:hypothetical protein
VHALLDLDVTQPTSFRIESHIMVNEAGSTPTRYSVSYINSTKLSSFDNNIENLTRDAFEHVKKVSFLPIDPEIDSLVDYIVNEATSEAKPSPLTRRV